MELKEAEKGELEKLAEMRAKRRLRSWGEQLGSPWTWLMVLLGLLGFYGLLIVWTGWSNGEFSVAVPVLVTLIIVVLGWFLSRRQKVREKKMFREFYEEELLQLKLKK